MKERSLVRAAIHTTRQPRGVVGSEVADRIMRTVLLLSAKIEGPVDIFLVVFVCVYEREGRGTERLMEKRRDRSGNGRGKHSGVLFNAEERKYSDDDCCKEKWHR